MFISQYIFLFYVYITFKSQYSFFHKMQWLLSLKPISESYEGIFIKTLIAEYKRFKFNKSRVGSGSLQF